MTEEQYQRVTQPLPEAPGGSQILALRTITRLVAGPILHDGIVHDLSGQELVFRTDFDGPWQVGFVGIAFYQVRPAGDEEPVYNREAKDVYLATVMGGFEIPFIDRKEYKGIGVVESDFRGIMGPGDQLVVRAKGTGIAVVEVRGVRL